PTLAAVGRDIHAAVIARDHALGVAGIDPQVMVITVVQALYALERLAAVDALQHRHLRAPDHVRIPWIDSDRRVIPGSLAQIMAGVDQLPGIAAIIRSVKSSLFGFDQRIDPAWF